jgi:gluconolactonase
LSIVVLDQHLSTLVDKTAEAQVVATGFVFTEGPLWDSYESRLIFSDVYGNKMHCWSEKAGVSVLRDPSSRGNGNTWDSEGRLITCEDEGRRVVRAISDGGTETVASHFEGKRLNSPNDVICLASGDLVFTDPPYGLRLADGSFGPQELDFQGVFRVSHRDGSISVLVDDFDRPNGLAASGNGPLYVADTARHHVRAFDLSEDGSVRNAGVFADVSHGGSDGRPDGMKLDSLGNLYVAANTEHGVWVFNPDGHLLGFIGVPEPPSNLAWGGEDRKTLFVTARTSVYQVPMLVAGQPQHR